MSIPPLRVLISGAGIAGNALAILLAKQGHAITVIERFPQLRTSGLQVDLRGHGIEVLKRMGLEEAFRARTAPEMGMRIVDKEGRDRAFFPANTDNGKTSGKKKIKDAQNFTSEYEIMRGDFCTLLYEKANASNVKYIFGDSVSAVNQDDSGIEVQFERGQPAKYDLLVGADGVHSRTRAMMLAASPADATTTAGSNANGFFPIPGTYIAYFNAPIPIAKDEAPAKAYVASLYMAPGSRGIMTRRSKPDMIQVYAGGRSDPKSKDDVWRDIKRGDISAEKRAIRQMLTGAGWRTDEFLDAMDKSDDFYCERLGLVKLDKWSNGRIVLLGDRGAYILAGEIGKHCGREAVSRAAHPSEGVRVGAAITAALESYETKFRPFMDQVQNGVLEDEGWGSPDSAWGLTLYYWAAAVAAFFKVNIGKMMMKENVKGWELPDY